MPTGAHKFEKGEAIATPTAAAVHILGEGWVYYRDQLQHPAWAENWSLAFLRQHIRAGRIHYAIQVRP